MLNAPAALSRVRVIPIVAADERQRWDELMKTWHYLRSARMVGEQLRYAAVVDGEWVALLGWSAAALKSGPRRDWVGWQDVVQERQHLHQVVQNARFLILPGCRVKNLASRVLALNCQRLSQDWQEAYGHEVLLAETFVDEERFRGTCYRAAGWEEIGITRGVRRERTSYVRHGVRKRLLVRFLHHRARQRLLAADDARVAQVTPQEIHLSGTHGLLESLRTLEDPRKRKGRRYRLPTLLALLVAGMLAGRTDVEHIAAWARGLPPRILKRFGCPRRRDGTGYWIPCANAYRYLLQDLDPILLDRCVRTWLLAQGITTAGVVIAIDGKTLTGSASLDQDARKAVSLFLHHEGITIAQQEVPAHTTEVPCARTMIAEPELNLAKTVITADAAHATAENAEAVLKKTPTTSCPSKATSPSWRLRWPSTSISTARRPSPSTITDTVATSIAR